MFSVNGVINPADNCVAKEGAAITFPAAPASISGKSFVGWTSTTISGTTDTAPTFVTSATMGSGDVTVPAGKPYLTISSGEAKSFIGFHFGGDATVITEVQSSKNEAVIYNLAGQRVTAPTHGLYIVNGKKVFIK